MYSLDKIQVDKIAEDVKTASITISHLADDLIDHICCEVENMIEDGESFESAYEIVKKETGISVLQKIQEDTKFLIDKNYRRMKTTMKITGNISLGVIMFGTVFKIMHWPGAGILLAFGFLILCTVFFPLAVHINYKNASKKKNLLLHIAILLGGTVFMTGVLFKIMHWPGAGMLILIGDLSLLFLFLPILLYVKIKESESKKDKRIYTLGIISLLIFWLSSMFKIFHWPGAAPLMLLGALLLITVFLPIFTWRRIKLEGKITGQFIYIIIMSMFLILFTSLLALNVSRDFLNVCVKHADNETLKNNYLENKNSLLLTDIESKTDTLGLTSKAKIIKQESDELCEYINEIQIDLISKIEQVDKEKASELLNNPRAINKKDNIDFVNILLVGKNGKGKAIEIKAKLNEYKSRIIAESNENAEIVSLLDNLINLSDKTIWEETVSWERYYFQHYPLIRVIGILNEFKNNVRIAESMALEYTNNELLTLNTK